MVKNVKFLENVFCVNIQYDTLHNIITEQQRSRNTSILHHFIRTNAVPIGNS